MTTAYAPAASVTVDTVAPLIVQVRELWADDWVTEPRLQVMRARACSAGQDLGSAVFRYRYGQVKFPHTSDLAAVAPIDLHDYWVRLVTPVAGNLVTQWAGRITGESRAVFGTSPEASAYQDWTAYEPLHLLGKTPVPTSSWLEGGSLRTIGWSPAFNARDERQLLVGNRSSAKYGGCYRFSSDGEVWSRYDIVEYLLTVFASGGASDPEWTLAGQADMLTGVYDHVRVPEGVTLDKMLRELIPVRFGLDYTIVPFSGGFGIYVYPLTDQTWTFSSSIFGPNSNTARVSVDDPTLESVNLVTSREHYYSQIRVRGRRIVVCCTFAGDQFGGLNSLEPRWDSSLASDYQDGTGTPDDEGKAHDIARKSPLYEAVYQAFGAPTDWNHQAGSCSPAVDEYGQVSLVAGDYQNLVKNTLSYLPLKSGVDYANGGEVDHNPAGVVPEFLAPLVWLYDTTNGAYVPADKAGISVAVPADYLGVQLSAKANHLLALNHWSAAAATAVLPVYDYEYLAATLAFEADQRLELTYTPGIISSAPTAGTLDTLDIYDPDAELWILAPWTMVRTTTDGLPVYSGPTRRELRNDIARLQLLMAGAAARYTFNRVRGTVVFNGLLPWGNAIGKLLELTGQANDTDQKLSPIVSVDWVTTGRNPTTTIKTGFAR